MVFVAVVFFKGFVKLHCCDVQTFIICASGQKCSGCNVNFISPPVDWNASIDFGRGEISPLETTLLLIIV